MRAAIVLACLAAGLTPAVAATYQVDDSGSLPRESNAVLDWRAAAPSKNADDTLQGTFGVLLRLNVGAWINHVGRLYLVLPEQTVPLIRLNWRTQGRLLPGQALPGQRVLIFEGPITTSLFEEKLELGIEARGSRLTGIQPLTFHFEIDVD
jgi:hypothetical protein